MRISSDFDEKTLEKLRVLYEESFPEDEKKPFELLLQKRDERLVELLAVFDERDAFRALAIMALHGDIALLDYFAVVPQRRGMGIGGSALEALKEIYSGQRIVLEIEDDELPSEDATLRVMRKNFYLKHDMRFMPYKVNYFGVQMRVLTNGSDIDFDEYHELYREVFGNEVSERISLV